MGTVNADLRTSPSQISHYMIRRKEQKPQSAEWNQSQEMGIPNVQDRFIPEKRPKTLHSETITSDNNIYII